MRAPAALLVPLALLLAGCVSEPVEPAAADLPPLLEDALAALDAGAPSANLRLLGEWNEGNAAEIDAWGDFIFTMRAGKVHILNVTDPGNITETSVIAGAHRVLDVKVSDDGAYLFVGDDNRASGALGGKLPQTSGGVYVYNVSDKANPVLVSYQPVGEQRGPHMLAYHRYPDGREVVFGANGDVSMHVFDRATGTLTEVSRYAPDLVFAYNRHPEVVDVLYQGWAHDMFPMTEPDGKVYLYVANWDAGLRIVDVTDPAAPKELGGWNEFPSGHEGNLHTVAAEWIDGRRIVVGSTEVGFAVVGGYHYVMGTDAGILYVWDATDPAKPQLLSAWENPDGIKSGRDQVPGETITSTHNLQLEEGRVYLAHYGLGLWVLDVSTPENQAAPEVVAFTREEGFYVWDALPHKGVTYTSGAQGVLAWHYLADVLGEAGVTGRA